MVKALKKSRYLLIFLILLSIISSFFAIKRWAGGEKWEWIIAMDGRGYYAYLPALFIFSDPTYSFYEKYTPLDGDPANFSNKTEKGTVDKYYYGEAFLLSPFFFIAHTISKIGGYPLSGYSKPYYLSVMFASIFYFLAGCVFLWLLLRKMNFNKNIAFATCVAYSFGTNLFYYAVYEPSMSHIYSFFAISAFLYSLISYFKEPQKRTFLFASFLLGIVVVIRPVNVLILTLIPFIAGDLNHLKNGFTFIFRNYLIFILSFLIVLFLIFGQLLLYYWQTGQFIIWSYKDEGFNFSNPQIINSLFSYTKGFFVYTPLALISLAGFFLFKENKRYLFFSALIPLFIIIYVVSSWSSWSYGWSYGLRAYIDYYPFFAILLAYLLDKCFKKKWSIAIIIILSATIAFSAIQTYQINVRILHQGDMNKERYWKVFLKTNSKYENIFY